MTWQQHSEDTPMPRHRRSHLAPLGSGEKLNRVRWWINLVFIIAALAGMVLWFAPGSRQVATYLLIGAVVLKFIEATLRILKL